MKKLMFVVLFYLWLPSSHAAFVLHMKSDANDYIGGGSTYDFNDANSTLSASEPNAKLLTVSVSPPTGYWSMSFYAPDGMQSGPYFNAARYPFQGPLNPGLSVSGNGRGCNTLSGHYVVYELTLIAGQISSLALDFEQHCEGREAALHGSLRIDSAIPIPAGAPVAYAGRNQQVVENSTVTLDAAQSYSPSGAALTFYWEQLSGTPVTLAEPNLAGTSFIAPQGVALGGEDLLFQVRVSNSPADGYETVDDVRVHVASKSDPMTFIHMLSQAGDYIGQGKDWYYDLSNAQITPSAISTYGFSVNVNAGPYWTLSFAAPKAESLLALFYDNATRYPFEDPALPGLSVSGDGRGCNTLTGNFDVISVDTAKLQFAANFEQHCEGLTPALTGEVRINAVDPSVPNADAGANQTVREYDVVTLDGSASSDSDGVISTFAWRQLSGPLAVLSDENTANPNFTAPTLPAGKTSDTLVFELIVEDDQLFKARSEVIITLIPGNHAPVANDDSASTYKRRSVDIAVLDNDSDDVQLDVTSVAIENPPANGNVSVNSSGVVTYSPRRGFIGTDLFTYTVKDNEGRRSNIANVTVTVSGYR